MPVTHVKISAKSDGADASKIQPSDWNSSHIGGTPNIVVAAVNARADSISAAALIYRCNGTADQVEIQAAIDAVATLGGVVQLTEGTFTINGPLTPKSLVTLRGMGGATTIKLANGTGGKMFYEGAGGLLMSFKDFVVDGNAANQSDVLEINRNLHAPMNLINITALLLKNILFSNATSGASLLLQSCSDVRLSNLRMQTNGKAITGGHTAQCDHMYLGDCRYVQITNYFAESCTDTGIVIDGSEYVTLNGYVIRNVGVGGQCIAVSTSGGKQAAGAYDAHVTIGPGDLIGSSGGTANGTRGIRIGRFGQASVNPSNVQITAPNISGVDQGISVDEGTRIDITNPQIKLHASAGVYQGFFLGAASTLVNITGGRVQNALVGIRFEPSAGALRVTGLDLLACTAATSGTIPVGTRAVNCPGWITLNSGFTGSISDGSTITHGLKDTTAAAGLIPNRIGLLPSAANVIVGATGATATTITVAIKNRSDGLGTSAILSWEAEKVY